MIHVSDNELFRAIQDVRKLVLNEDKLRCSTSDEFLTRFIKASKYDAQKSFQLIQDFFKTKIDFPNEFQFKSPTNYISVMSRLGLGYIMPKVDFVGRKILLLRLGDIDPNRENWSILMQTATMVLEALSYEPEIQDSGVNLIFDCTNFSLKLMKWATPHKMHTIMTFLQDCIPLRFEIYHVVNAPLLFNVFFTAIKPFMKEEFIKKLKWHYAPFTTLQKYMDSSLIPKNIGGTLNEDLLENWYDIVLDKELMFQEQFSMGYV